MRFLSDWRRECAQRRDAQAGFTLIELLVSAALFSVVLVLSVSALLVLVDANRKAQSLKSVTNNLNFGIDSVTRTLRTGHSFYCANNVEDMPEGTLACPSGASGITLRADTGALVGYRLQGSTIERRTVDGSDDSGWIALTAPEVQIAELLFYVTGAENDDGVQPTVTLAVRGEAGVDLDTDTTFNVQTTVAQRLLSETTVGTSTQSGTGSGSGSGGSGYELFTTSGTFTAPSGGTYRVLAVGGGGGGSHDEGAGGGSGYVAYTTVTLAADETVTVTVGAGGAATLTGPGGDGGSTSFGSYLTASGGSGGGASNQPGGDGGSGGSGDPNASGAGQTGGSGGGNGTSTGAGAGSGQGSSFYSNFSNITSVTLSAGVGGTTNTQNGDGGGGAGGVMVDGDSSIQGGDNQVNSARGGVGYGAGGAGGNGNVGGGQRSGGAGAAGVLVVEWD